MDNGDGGRKEIQIGQMEMRPKRQERGGKNKENKPGR